MSTADPTEPDEVLDETTSDEGDDVDEGQDGDEQELLDVSHLVAPPPPHSPSSHSDAPAP